jgi:hypothetical protein
MPIWIFIILAILLYIYVSYYYRYPPIAKVLFAEATPFPEPLLFEKQPIVLMNATQLPSYKGKTLTVQANQWYKNQYKYTFLHPQQEQEVHLLPPTQKIGSPEATLMTLQMKPNQVLVIPFHWQYNCEKEVHAKGVHDWISWILP